MKNFPWKAVVGALFFFLSCPAFAGTPAPIPTALKWATPTCTPLVIARGDPDPPAAVPTAQETGPALKIVHSALEKRLVLKEGSGLLVSGSTTRRDFELGAGVLLGSAILKTTPDPSKGGQALLSSVKEGGVQAMNLVVPVDNLVSANPQPGENTQYSLAGPHVALKGKDFPYVQFRLEDEKLVVGKKPGTYVLKASGKLTIAGVTKDIRFDAQVDFPGNEIHIAGSYRVRMKDFQIQVFPDVWGSMGGDPSVEVAFDVLFGPDKPTAP